MKGSSENIYNEEFSFIHHKLRGFVTFEEFKRLCETIHDMMKEKTCVKVLVDLENMEVMTQQAQLYIQNDWFPISLGLGLKRMALVIPQSAFGKMSMENATKEQKESNAFPMEYFPSLEQAIEFLKVD